MSRIACFTLYLIGVFVSFLYFWHVPFGLFYALFTSIIWTGVLLLIAIHLESKEDAEEIYIQECNLDYYDDYDDDDGM